MVMTIREGDTEIAVLANFANLRSWVLVLSSVLSDVYEVAFGLQVTVMHVDKKLKQARALGARGFISSTQPKLNTSRNE
jgi:hypothetical protein